MELTAMATNVAALLKKRKCKVSVVESSAGGLISASLLSIPGASNYFVGGGVIYTRDARRGLLGLPEEVATMRGSCEEYALIAAQSMRKRLGTDWALCETGASGPSNNSYGIVPGIAVLRLQALSKSRLLLKLKVTSVSRICGILLRPP